MADIALLRPRGAFDDQLAACAEAPAGHPLALSEGHFGLATVMLQAGRREALSGVLGADLPDGPERRVIGDMALIGTGPDVWLAAKEDADPLWGKSLVARLAGAASVSDQSSGYAVLRIGGAASRDLLSRGAFIDLHPSRFGPGSAVVTVIAHIGVILWQRDDAPTYEVALFRSYAGSFWHWIEATAAGMGVTPLRGSAR